MAVETCCGPYFFLGNVRARLSHHDKLADIGYGGRGLQRNPDRERRNSCLQLERHLGWAAQRDVFEWVHGNAVGYSHHGGNVFVSHYRKRSQQPGTDRVVHADADGCGEGADDYQFDVAVGHGWNFLLADLDGDGRNA